jgi:cob(I)alamin adenosyltransferase
MSLYTRYGDHGRTRRVDGPSESKASPRVCAQGDVDELCVCIGSAASYARQMASDKKTSRPRQAELGELAGTLDQVQRQLFSLGAMVSHAGLTDLPTQAVTITETTLRQMEIWIDKQAASLPEQTEFLLPGGCELACRFQLARAVCRRAERALTLASEQNVPLGEITQSYINRLSDLLFVLARRANTDEQTSLPNA